MAKGALPLATVSRVRSRDSSTDSLCKSYRLLSHNPDTYLHTQTFSGNKISKSVQLRICAPGNDSSWAHWNAAQHDRFPANLEAFCKLSLLDRTAALTRGPKQWRTGRERCLPYRIRVAGHAAGVSVPVASRVLRMWPQLRAGTRELCPGRLLRTALVCTGPFAFGISPMQM
ncbi:hypothetical protein TREES_T100011384 [Tupaia chinensis]|uniref:Uncharacterized protein n=1 Tax=Tupaia chinensis TaxID=246437 RepID=L9LCF1_TUPCH|nr:hypothetical protein TREES_T100011384 [Tupaia chinensis]